MKTTTKIMSNMSFPYTTTLFILCKYATQARKILLFVKNLQDIGVVAHSLNHPVCSTEMINHCLSDGQLYFHLQVTGQ
jgi:hypothetical protein